MKVVDYSKTMAASTLLATVLAAGINSASAAPITLVNQGFETGDLTGWSSIGDVVAEDEINVVTNNGTNYALSPHQTTMAYLNSSGATVNEIESFLGLGSGSLYDAQDTGPTVNTDGNFELTNGSAISQSFVANAGDTVDMSWNYVARDYIPYTDPAFGVLIAPDGTAMVDVLASTTGPGLATGSDGISGVFSFAKQLTQMGTYTLGFAVTNSGDTALNSALFLDNQAGDCNPSCNDLGSPQNPLLPDEDETPESFDFTFEVTEPSTPIFIDPEIAVGYDYIVNEGPNVASVILPDLGDGEFSIYGWNGSEFGDFLGEADAGIEFFFGAGGVDQFQVLGIETAAMLDPTDPTAFVTGLTFVDSGSVSISQIPITENVADVPEPASLPMLGIALVGMFFLRRYSLTQEIRTNGV